MLIALLLSLAVQSMCMCAVPNRVCSGAKQIRSALRALSVPWQTECAEKRVKELGRETRAE